MYTTLLALMFACGDAEETQTIPTPPAKEVKEAPKPEPKAEAPKPEPKEEAAVVADASGKDGDAAAATPEADTVGGTQPDVQTSEKLMTTGEVNAPQSKLLPNKVERMLKGKAKKEGYQTIKNFKLIKNECQAGGICTGIGQGTAVKTTVTYSEGNGVSVKQEDGSAKDAIVSKIDGDNFTVKYADGTEATVAKSAVGLKK